MVDHTTDGQHSKTSVLNFLEFQCLHFLCRLLSVVVLGVEANVSWDTAGVVEHGFHAHVSLPVGNPLNVTASSDDLSHGGNTNDGGSHVGVVNVLVSWDGNKLLEDESNGGKHGSTSVLEFGFTKPLKVEVVAETKGVETNITNHGSIQVLGPGQERHGLRHFSVELSAHSRFLKNCNVVFAKSLSIQTDPSSISVIPISSKPSSKERRKEATRKFSSLANYAILNGSREQDGNPGYRNRHLLYATSTYLGGHEGGGGTQKGGKDGKVLHGDGYF